MKLLKERVRIILKSQVDIKYIIRQREPDYDTMKKATFIEVLEQLRVIEDRTDFLNEEIGMDLSMYEEQFFTVIESLFKLVFNKAQLALIQMYLYQLTPDKGWDGTLTLEVNKTPTTVPFQTPSEVWEVIKELE